jgi:hypothetical protein
MHRPRGGPGVEGYPYIVVFGFVSIPGASTLKGGIVEANPKLSMGPPATLWRVAALPYGSVCAVCTLVDDNALGVYLLCNCCAAGQVPDHHRIPWVDLFNADPTLCYAKDESGRRV